MARVVATLLAFAAPAAAVSLRRNSTQTDAVASMTLSPHQFMEVKLGPFASAPEACDYCFSSFSKAGSSASPHAGPVTDACTCMAYPSDGGFDMFCSNAPSAAAFVGDKGGCTCKAKDMEAMGKTTCAAI